MTWGAPNLWLVSEVKGSLVGVLALTCEVCTDSLASELHCTWQQLFPTHRWDRHPVCPLLPLQEHFQDIFHQNKQILLIGIVLESLNVTMTYRFLGYSLTFLKILSSWLTVTLANTSFLIISTHELLVFNMFRFPVHWISPLHYYHKLLSLTLDIYQHGHFLNFVITSNFHPSIVSDSTLCSITTIKYLSNSLFSESNKLKKSFETTNTVKVLRPVILSRFLKIFPITFTLPLYSLQHLFLHSHF